jgi:integrase
VVGDLNYAALEGYFDLRVEQGAAEATAKQELAALRRALRLTLRTNKEYQLPVFPTVKVDNARKEFVSDDEAVRVLRELRGDVRAYVVMVALTGWRNHEVGNLTWDMVDTERQVITLPGRLTKNGKDRVYVYADDPDMTALLAQQAFSRDQVQRSRSRLVLWVFHRPNGDQIEDFRTAWNNACERAGCPGKWVHDWRRTVRRRMVQAGIPQGVVMAAMGWKTREVFDRYGISPEEDLRKAAADDAAKRPDYLRLRPAATWAHGGHIAGQDQDAQKSGSA